MSESKSDVMAKIDAIHNSGVLDCDALASMIMFKLSALDGVLEGSGKAKKENVKVSLSTDRGTELVISVEDVPAGHVSTASIHLLLTGQYILTQLGRVKLTASGQHAMTMAFHEYNALFKNAEAILAQRAAKPVVSRVRRLPLKPARRLH